MIIAALVGALVACWRPCWRSISSAPRKQIERSLEHRYGVTDPQFLRELGSMLGPAIVDGNAVQNLENGARIFPAMLEAIRGAERSITFESYIYWSGQHRPRLRAALEERARAGVHVHVLIDWAGSQDLDSALVDEMKAAGVEVQLYHPLRWYNLARMNNRTHRKIAGGRRARRLHRRRRASPDPWDGNAQDAEHWRDSHYRLEGPAVAQMQPPSWTTGSRPRQGAAGPRNTSRPCSRWARRWRRCSPVRPAAAATACS
jgi:cardiolipin synthase